MKKNLYNIALMVTAVLSLTGCKDSFLEVEPGTRTTLEEYFSTPEHVYEAVISAYQPMRLYDWNGSQYAAINVSADVMGDNFWPGGSDRTDNQHWHLMNNFESTPLNALTGVWDQSYRGVKAANDVLTYVGWAAENLTEAQKAQYTAEAQVLRDWYYCQLWKFYGNIPFYLDNLQAPYLAEQLSADEVYNQVIADLESAIASGALPMYWEDESQLGRVTQAVAYMLYAEMVMYQNDESRYATALGYMQQIIGNAHYGLMESYPEIWATSGEWSKESIWEIAYCDGVNGKRAYEGGVGNVGGTWLPRLISPDGGVAADGVDNGWGFFPVRQEAYAKFQDGDTRRDATCYVPAEGSYKPRYEDTGIWLNKYVARAANLQDINGATDANYNNNLRMYRYAETLLNAAELIVRTGGNIAQAQEYLNLVHHRAGLTDNKAATIDNIIDERDLEFMGEGKRYWDLVRTGKAASVLVPDADGYRTNTWSASKKYLPIPQNEIDAAQGTLTQNNY